jgi:hypothetical protein
VTFLNNLPVITKCSASDQLLTTHENQQSETKTKRFNVWVQLSHRNFASLQVQTSKTYIFYRKLSLLITAFIRQDSIFFTFRSINLYMSKISTTFWLHFSLFLFSINMRYLTVLNLPVWQHLVMQIFRQTNKIGLQNQKYFVK